MTLRCRRAFHAVTRFPSLSCTALNRPRLCEKTVNPGGLPFLPRQRTCVSLFCYRLSFFYFQHVYERFFSFCATQRVLLYEKNSICQKKKWAQRLRRMWPTQHVDSLAGGPCQDLKRPSESFVFCQRTTKMRSVNLLYRFSGVKAFHQHASFFSFLPLSCRLCGMCAHKKKTTKLTERLTIV